MDNDYRADERRRREAAQAGTAEVQGGQAVPPRALKQMLSVRLEPRLLRGLRLYADERDLSVSDVLRQAAIEFLDRARRAAFVLSANPAPVQQSINVTWTHGTPTCTGSVASSPAERVA